MTEMLYPEPIIRFPIIRIRDKETGYEHIVGSDVHDVLYVNRVGSISYYNLQNGDGSGPSGCYRFVGKKSMEFEAEIEFVTFEELQRIHQELLEEKKRSRRELEKLILQLLEEDEES